MSIENLQILSMNPHFYGLLLQGFLSGYKRPCEMRFIFMVLPILLYSESRDKLATARNTSKMETIFNKSEEIEDNVKISGKVKLAGYFKRYEELIPFSKKALIILYTKKRIVLTEKKVVLIKPIKYSDFDGSVRKWVRTSYYLGVIFANTSEDHLNYFLGVDRQ